MTGSSRIIAPLFLENDNLKTVTGAISTRAKETSPLNLDMVQTVLVVNACASRLFCTAKSESGKEHTCQKRIANFRGSV